MGIPIGALWLKEKDGKKYFSGSLQDLHGEIRIVVFKNDNKTKDTQPDYQILLSEERKDRPQEAQSAQQQTEKEVRIEDLPF